MVLQDLYETEYHIYNHLNGNRSRPLAAVALHPCEDINDGSLLEEALRSYVVRGIGDIFKLNLLEFLELPVDIVSMLNSIANEEGAKKAGALSSIETQFNKVL